MPDTPLTPARLRQALGARPFQFYPQTGSTNDLARHWATDQNAPAGALVITEEQTSGRGRFDRKWDAPPGSALLFSVVLRPQIALGSIGRVTMLGALAVAESLDGLVPGHVALKWPNDVQLDGRKVAGLLAEADWVGHRLNAVIFGIGLNISTNFSQSPLEHKAVSVETISGQTVDRAALLAGILRRMDYWLPRIEQAELLQVWRSRLSTLGKPVTASLAGQDAVIHGIAVDVDADGALLIEDAASVRHRVIAGEVTLSGQNS